MGTIHSWLQHSGLSNSQTEDLGAIASSSTKLQFRYYCTSSACAGRSSSNPKPKFKFISSQAVFNCPDCQCAMFSKRMK